MIANIYSSINRTYGFVTLCCLSTILFVGMGASQLNACSVNSGPFSVTTTANASGNGFLNAAALNSNGAGITGVCNFVRYYDASVGGNLLYTEQIGVDPGYARVCGTYTIYFEADETAAPSVAATARQQVTFTVTDPVLNLPATGAFTLAPPCDVSPGVVTTYLSGIQLDIAAASTSNCNDIDAVWIVGDEVTTGPFCFGTFRDSVVTHRFEVTNNHGITENYFVEIRYRDFAPPSWDAPPANPGFQSFGPVAGNSTLNVQLNCNDSDFATDLAFWEGFVPSATDNCYQAEVDVTLVSSITTSTGLCFNYEVRERRYVVTDGCVESTDTFVVITTLIDDEAPVVTATDTVTVFTDDFQGGLNCEYDFDDGLDLLEISVSDCRGTSSTWEVDIITAGGSATPSSGSGTNAQPVLTEGEYEITYFTTDGCLTTATSIYIRVVNNNGLLATCPPNIVQGFDAGQCGTNVAWARPDLTGFCVGDYEDYWVSTTAIDTEGNSIVVINPIGLLPDPTGAFFGIGEWTITYNYEDGLGDPYSCSFTVTVEDNAPPVITDCGGPTFVPACDSVGVPSVIGTITYGVSCAHDTVFQDIAAGTLLQNVPGLTVSVGEEFDITVTVDDGTNTATCIHTISLGATNAGPVAVIAGNLPDITPNTDLDAGCGEIIVPRPTAIACNGDVILGVANEGAIDGGNSNFWNFSATVNGNVVWTYDDGSSTSQQLQFVNVTNDIREPIVTCPININVNTNPGECTATGFSGIAMTEIAPFLPYAGPLSPGQYTDDCGPTTIQYEINGGGFVSGNNAAAGTFDLGPNTVVYRVEDDNSNVSTCSFTVTVVDNEPPSFTCPSPQTLFTSDWGTGGCSITFDDSFDPTNIDDNCDPMPSVSWSTPGFLNPLGLTMTPSSGSSLDGVVADITPNIGGFGLGAGLVTVRWTVTDDAGNSSTCDVAYTILDDEAPEIDCPTDITVSYVGDGGAVNVCSYTASGGEFDFTSVSDNCFANTPTYLITGATNTSGAGSINGVVFNIGVHNITWAVSDPQGNTDDCMFTVTVADDQAPSIDFTTAQECGDTINIVSTSVECNPPISWEQPILDLSLFECNLVTATRNITGAGVNGPAPAYDVNNNILAYVSAGFNLGTTDIVYFFADAAGNDTTCTITVVMEDETPPQLVACAGFVDLNGICDAVPIGDLRANAAFTDNCVSLSVFQNPSPTTSRFDANGGASLSDGDQITVRVWAEDASGNASDTCFLTVTFFANDNPIPTVTPLPTLSPDDSLSIGCGFVELVAPTATNCNGDVLLGVPSGGGTLTDVNGDGTLWLIQNLTPVTITWTYNNAGNIISQNQTILFEDNDRDPRIVCYPNQTFSVISDCSYNPESVLAGILDFTFINPVTPYNSFTLNPGEYTDICDTNPVVSWEVSGATSGSGTDTNPGDFDFNVGVNTVTVTVTDDQGQDASCSFTVTVEDNIDPVFTTCPGNQNVSTDMDECFATVTGIDVVVDENCEIDSISYVISGATTGSGLNNASGTEFEVGVSTVLYTAVDTSGNFSTCSFTVTVTDNQDPDIVCATLNTEYPTDPGVCDFTVVGTGFDPDVDDNCGVANVTNDYNSSSSLGGAVFPVGSTDVLWTVTDVNSNTNTCQITVTVEDMELPVLDCNPDSTYYLVTADCFRYIEFPVDPSDNCGINVNTFSVSSNNPSTIINPGGGNPLKVDAGGNFFFNANVDQGVTEFTYTIDDIYGNTSLPCVFTVTLLDTIRPILNSCDGTAFVNSICDNVDLPSFTGNASITDNCTPLNFFQSPAAGTDLIDANGGTSLTDGDQITVLVWATDNSGNVSDTCSITVTFNADDIPVPAISSLPDINPGNTLEAGCGPFAIDAPIATTCNGDTIYATTGGAGITDLGTTPPSYQFDNFNGNVIWGYDDGFGNTTSQNQNIQVTSDTAAPVVACPVDLTVDTDSSFCTAIPNNTMGVDLGMTYVDPTSFFPPYPPAAGLNAGEYTDNCDTNPNVEFEFTGATTFGPAGIVGNDPGTETFNDGTTIVTVTVTDATGNTASCSYNVTVNDNEAPMFTTCPGNQNVNTDTGVCFATVSGIDVVVSENCQIDSISYVVSGVTTASGLNDASGTEFNLGTSTVTYTAVDTSGNFSTCQFTVNVSDMEPPVINPIICDTTLTNDTDLGLCTYTQSFNYGFVVSDNCTALPDLDFETEFINPDGSMTMMSGQIFNYAFEVGTTVVTLTATDLAGNTSTCETTFVVVDNELPVINCNPNDTITGLACELGAQEFALDFSDNCGVVLDSFATFNIDNNGVLLTAGGEIKINGITGDLFFTANIFSGLTTIQYTILDVNGNESLPCEFTVLLLENSNTDVVCQPNPSVNLDANGVANIPLNLVYSSHDGFCPNPTIVHSPTSVDCTDGDDVLVTVVVSDNAGNIDSCQTTLVINDLILPTAVCVDTFTAVLDSNGEVTITTSDIDNGSDDNTAPLCPLDLSLDITAFDCDDVGPNTVVLTVEDVYENVSTCSAVVNVVDNEAPSIVCPSNLDVDTDTGICTHNVTSLAPVSVDDNCGIDSVSYEISGASTGSGLSPVSNFDFERGISTVLFTATDVNGNTNTCSVTVTVTDDEAPLANMGICNNVDTVDTDAGVCTATLAYDFVGDDWFTDNCDAPSALTYSGSITNPDMSTTSFSGASPSLTFELGTSTLTVFATDMEGNMSLACVNTIEVEDNELPDPGCPANIDFGTAIDCDATIELFFNPTDNCGLEIDSFQLTFANFTQQPNIQNSGWRNGVLGGSPVLVEFGTGTTDVTFWVEDVNGNTNSCTFQVEVTTGNDDLSITCFTGRTVELDSDGIHTFSGADDLFGNIVGACAPTQTFFNPASVDCEDGTSVVVEIIYVDNAGQSDTCTTTVAIEDNIPPVANCVTAYTVELDSTGNQSITTSDIDNGSNDNTFPTCPLDLSLNVDQFSCADLGQVDVWLTVVDVYDNVDSCLVVVDVVDNLNPQIFCPDPVVTNTDSGVCTAVVNDIAPDSTWENCTIDSITYVITGVTSGSGDDDASGTAFELGVSTVTYTIYDNSLNSSTCSFTVEVEDNEPPVITCATQDTTVGTSQDLNPGDCVFSIGSANEAGFSASAIDNCAMPPMVTHNITGLASNTSLVGFDAPLGNTTIIWTADDGNGNTSSCSFVLTVEDDEDPFAGCPSDVTINTASGCNAVQFIGVSPSDNCGLDWPSFNISFDNNETTLVNNIMPAWEQAQNTGMIEVEFPTGVTVVTYSISDPSGNADTCSFNVTVTEGVNTGLLVCPDDITVELNSNGFYALRVVDLVTFPDGFCSPVTYVFSRDTLFCTDGEQINVTVDASDNAGNNDNCTVTVNIEDNINPTALCLTALDIFLDINGEATLDSNALDNGSFDNTTVSNPSCDLEFEIEQSEFDCSDLGTFTIFQVVTDVYDNVDTCYTSVTVLDTISPALNCPGNVIVSNDTGECSAEVDNIPPLSVMDNCSVVDTSFTFTGDLTGTGSGDASGTIFPVGTTTVTYTVEDQSGNTTSCDFSVTVNDDEPPVITCAFNPDTVVTTSGDGILGDCFYTVGTEFDASATDNCQVDSVWNDLTNSASLSGVDLGLGSHTIVWYAVDIYNNIDSCEITIEVEDDELPNPGCPGNLLFSNASGCGDVYQIGINAFDNCQLDTSTFAITFNRNDANVANPLDNHVANGSVLMNLPVGVTQVTYYIEDVNDNANSCTFTIGVTVGDPSAGVTLTCQTAIDVYLDPNGEYEFIEDDLLNTINGFCEPRVTTITPAVVDCEDRPSLTVQLKVEDFGGRIDSCTTLVTILDTIPPVALCQDTTVYLDAQGFVGIDSSFINDGSSDNADLCGLTMALSETAFDCDDVGGNSVILTVTDVFNNSSTCESTVTVLDTIPPTIECVGNQAQFNDQGDCGAIVSGLALVIANDNCAIDTIEYEITGATQASGGDDASGEFFSVGTSTVTYTVTDVNGNESTCDFEVVVSDNEVPEFDGPFANGDTLVFTSGDNVFYECFYEVIATEFDPVVTDNCGVDSVWNDWNNASSLAGVQFAPGTHEVRWYALDIHGNIDSIDIEITVEDDEAPIVTCVADVDLNANAGCDATRQFNIGFEDNCGINASSFTYFTDNPDVNEVSVNNLTEDGVEVTLEFPVGTTIVGWVIQDIYGNADTCYTTVNVFTTNGPIANCVDNFTAILDANGEYEPRPQDLLTNYTPGQSSCGIDTVMFSPDVLDCSNRPVTTVEVTVMDVAGLTDVCLVPVTITDTIPPVAICQDTTVYLDAQGFVSIDSSYINDGSTDNADLCGLTMSLSRMTFDCDDIENNPIAVTLTVTDVFGNSSDCVGNVTVLDTVPPVPLCPNDVVQDNDSGECGAEVINIDLIADDNCEVESWSYTISGATTGSDTGNASGSFFVAGTSTVLYTVIDVNNNSATCSFNVTINDVEDPVIVCSNDTLVTTSGDGLPDYDCLYVTQGSEFDPVSVTDNCMVDFFFNSENNTSSLQGVAFEAGTHTVTWTVQDTAGNTSSCNMVIEVVDDQAPILSNCPSDVTIQSAGNCGTTYSWAVPDSIDNCEIESLTVSSTDRPGFWINTALPGFHDAAFPVGSTTIQYMLTDTTGNADSCSFVVTVTGAPNTQQGPEITCQSAPYVAHLNVDGEFVIDTSTFGEYGVTIVSGECPISNKWVGQDILTCADRPQVQVTFYVNDGAGNVDSCQKTFTIVDTIAPVAECMDATIYLDATGFKMINETYIDNGSSDNADACGLDYDLSVETFGCADVDNPVTVTMTVTDVFGLQDSCTAVVTVLDTISPTVMCPTVLSSYVNDTGECGAEIGMLELVANDACGIASVSWSVSGATNDSGADDISGLFFNVGTSVVTYTAFDPSGNSTSCSFPIQVDDVEAPTIDCPQSPQTRGTGDDNLGLYDCAYTTQGTEFDYTNVDDNCAVDTFFHNQSGAASAQTLDGFVFGLGTTQVVWTVIDESNNSSTCVFTVNIEDNEAPDFQGTCLPDTTISSTLTSCDALFVWTTPVAIDNCQLVSTTEEAIDPAGNNIAVFANSSSTRQAMFPAGTSTVTYVATDAAGNSTTCEFEVTVTNSGSGPIAICLNAPDIILDANGQATIEPEDINPTYGTAGNCPLADVSVSPSMIDCSNLDQVVVTLTVVDFAGGSDQCQVTLNVIDNIDPTAVCDDFTVALSSSGNASVSATNIDNGSDDNCSIVSRELSTNGNSWNTSLNFSCSQLGPNVVYLRVTDQSGNSATCDATVTVEDNIPPVVSCPSDVTVGTSSIGSFDCIGSHTWTIPTPSDNCGISSFTEMLTGSTVAGPDNVMGQGGTSTTHSFELGTTTVVYMVTDVAGNNANCSFDVTVVDDQAPQISCPTNQVFATSEDGSGDCTFTYTGTALDATASDNCSGVGTVTNDFNSGSSLDGATFPVGTTTVEWSVVDATGSNSAFCTFTVTVEDDEAPEFSYCPPSVTIPTVGPGACNNNYTWQAPMEADIDDNCGFSGLTVTESVSSPYGTITITPTGYDPTDPTKQERTALFPIGTTTVSYTAVDDANNETICSFTVTVTESTPPVALCQDATVYLNASGTASITPDDVDNNSFDNCEIASMSVSPSTFGCNDVGTGVSVTLTVEDFSGNTATCTSTVTVLDTIPPMAACQDITVDLDGSGQALVEAEDVDANAGGNCSVTSYEISTDGGLSFLSSTVFTCADLGDQDVVLMITDQNSNTATCDAVVTVQDVTAPQITCPNGGSVVTSNNGTGDCTGSFTWTVPAPTDNCEVTVLEAQLSGATSGNIDQLNVQGQTVSADFNVGTTTVVYYVEDQSGNSTTCDVTVIVTDDEAPSLAGLTSASVTTSEDNQPGDCRYTVNGNEFDPTSFGDNCALSAVPVHNYTGGGVISNTTLANARFPVGTTNVVWSLTDDAGLTTSYTLTVTVTDDEPPVFLTCPSDRTVNASAFNCNQIVAWNLPYAISDNCGVATVSEDFSDPAVNPIHNYNFFNQNGSTGTALFSAGVTTVTYTATDVNGLTSVCSFDVTVLDNQAPVVTNCPTNAVITDICADTPLPNYTGGVTVTDNCTGNQSITQYPAAGTLLGDIPGLNLSEGQTFTVTVTATDLSPNYLSGSCSFEVTLVNDDVPQPLVPGPLLPTSNELACDGNSAIVVAPLANIAGGCNGPSQISAQLVPVPSGVVNNGNGTYTFPNGFNAMVTWVYTNGSNEVSQLQTIVVSPDNNAPVAVCQTATVSLNAMGTGSLTATMVDGGSFDNECSIASRSVSQTSFSCANLGANTVTLTVTDQNGNNATCNATVNVVDNIAPVAVCQNAVIELQPNEMVTLDPSMIDNGSSDNCGSISLAASPSVFGCGDTGVNHVMLTVTDGSGNTAQCSATVVVNNNLPPAVTCNDITVQLNGSGSANINLGMVADISVPCDANFTASLSRTNFNCADVGVNNVLVTAANSDNNQVANCTATVTVEDNIAPVIVSCPVNVLTCNAGVDIPALVATDNCGIDDITYVLSGATSGSGDGSVPITDVNFLHGITNINYTVTDVNGNTTTCLTVVTIDNTTEPTAICINDLNVNIGSSGMISIDAAFFNANSFDPGCPDTELSFQMSVNGGDLMSSFDFDCSSVGTNSIVLHAYDGAGNSGNCQTTLNVFDVIAPTAVCNSGINVSLGSNGTVEIDPADLDGGSSDNCFISFSASQTVFACGDIGPNSVTLMVTDSGGNTATCSTTVTVEDNMAPVAICDDPVFVINNPNHAIILEAADVDGGSFDNCGIASMSVTPSVFTCSNEGTNMVVLTVTDVNGNVSTCESMVTIICQEDVYVVSGRISTEYGYNLDQVEVAMTGSTSQSMVTGTNGNYTFTVDAGSNVTVTPTRDINYLEGLTTLDLILIQRHILQIEALDSPYKIIAADANKDDNLSVVDLVLFLNLIVGNLDELPDNDSWRFIPADFDFPNPENPFETYFPEYIEYSNITEDQKGEDYVAVKIGDVTDDIGQAQNAQSRAYRSLLIEDRELNRGEMVAVPVMMNGINQAVGYQFGLNFSTADLRFADVRFNSDLSNLMPANFSDRFAEEGVLRTNWFNALSQDIYNGMELMTLSFEVLTDGIMLSDVISMESDRFLPEAYDNFGEIYNLNVEFIERTAITADAFELFQNQPNPFGTETVIGFVLPEEMNVTIEIIDETGRLIRSYDIQAAEGYNALRVDAENLSSGLYYYRLVSDKYHAVKRMILQTQ